ncbi:hypothetical protein LIER_18141 [Lithospermum erythrorhizon]|uniref:Uncharacterized protein n=1 Tax=Lithospermum erythrorhizon TaxID=34254 RepID=A0AAV3QFH6_LITER
MGTQVQCKSYLGGHKPMKDLNDDCNGNGWHLFYGEKNLGNRQYQTTFLQRTVVDAHTGHDKNGLKLKILEHDAIFKNQVHELHRLYRTQRDMMVEIKPKEGHGHGDLINPSLSTSIQGPQAENGGKWPMSTYPMVSSVRSTELGTDNVTSPLSWSKGNYIPSSQVLLQNGFSKDYKVSEARPSKVRKKLIDLQLPADESDTEEAEQQDTRTFGSSSLSPNQEYNIRLESSVKLSNGGLVREKTDSVQEGCIFVSNTRMSTGLADLNEPAEVEETTELSSAKIFCSPAPNGAIKGIDSSAKPNSGFLGLPSDVIQKPGHFLDDSLNDFPTENNVTRKKWLKFPNEAEHSGGSRNMVSRSFQQEKLSFHATPSKVLSEDHLPGVHFANHIQETLGKQRMAQGLEGVHRSQRYANHTRRDPIADFQLSNSYPFLGSSGVSHTIHQIMSPWGKPADSLSPELTSLHSQNSHRGVNKILQSSALNDDILGEKWYANDSSHPNPGETGDPPSRNVFFHGSSSGSKESPVFGFDHLLCSRSDKVASSLLVNHGMDKACMAYSCMDVKPLRDLNLNETSRNASNDAVLLEDLEIMDGNGKSEDRKPLLPWLQTKQPFMNEAANPEINVISISSSPPRASQSSLYGERGTGKELKGMYNTAFSTNLGTWPENGRYGTQCVERILGVPIYEKVAATENEIASLLSSTPERENVKQDTKKYIIDINVACDVPFLQDGDESDAEEVVKEKPLDESSSVRYFIDLNSHVTEDEDHQIPSGKNSTVQMRFVADFDLEAPAVPEEDGLLSEKEKEQNILPQLPNCESEQLDDEVLMTAAETMVDISSCQDKSWEKNVILLSGAVEFESLLWFAGVAASTADKLESSSGKECSCKEMDDFEAATLLLPDTKEEDFLPKPFVIEVLVEEAEANALPIRPRRSQARRGRQRKDFQRDILPGLVSLSRHEMTEDLQTFGGLMRATGHAWNSGSTRRHGGTRGRRRKVVERDQDYAPVGGCTQQLTNVETNLEDRRSLTGWGKTTRRPRRQRCPASNAPSVALT